MDPTYWVLRAGELIRRRTTARGIRKAAVTQGPSLRLTTLEFILLFAARVFFRRDQSCEGGRPYTIAGHGGGVIGPSLPSASDHQASERRDYVEAEDHLEYVATPKEVGREGMLKKKRAPRENDRAFQEKVKSRGLRDILTGIFVMLRQL
ncbi:hypothetical protein J3R83DRAFT_6023 [Lanmaoa asiatica]|nr:hypothetical protein J3R83DRAFT_6023 [Lanmaoa asiatica]